MANLKNGIKLEKVKSKMKRCKDCILFEICVVALDLIFPDVCIYYYRKWWKIGREK